MDTSVIIPCFNGRRYLAGLAENLKSSAPSGTEIIFVDDGSTDGSLEAFRELMPGANCIRQKNAGVAAARNTGAKAATGEFLQFLDVDDTIAPEKLPAQTAFARQGGFDAVYSDWRMVIVDGDKVTHEPFCQGEAPVEIVEALLGGWWQPPHSYLIRRDAYWEVGGSDETLVNAQDFDLVVRLGIAGKRFGYSPGHFADYYRHLKGQSLARGPRRQYWSDYEKAIEKALRLLQERDALTLERRQAATQKFHSIARNVFPISRDWYSRLMDRVFQLDPQFGLWVVSHIGRQ